MCINYILYASQYRLAKTLSTNIYYLEADGFLFVKVELSVNTFHN